ncbi:MAG: hypothetical protein WAV23_04500 [Minisyncoccia bacterium]
MKTKNSKEQIIDDLVRSVLRLPVEKLHQDLLSLDSERYLSVLNKLTPEKFLEFVKYDASIVEFSRVWDISFVLAAGIKKELLDILPPNLLIRIASKHSSGTSGWGKWDEDWKDGQGNGFCHDFSLYLFMCSPERVSEIINFLIGTCLNVKAPLSEIDKNIFVYKKGKEFPFEVIDLFFSVHPKVFFPALNSVSSKYLKKMFWLCQKFVSDDEGLENVFQSQYFGKYSFDSNRFSVIGEHIGMLKDEYLNVFLNWFKHEAQKVLFPKIGKERIIQLRKNNFSTKNLSFPEEWDIFNDKKSNESVFEKIQKGSQSIQKLNSKKKLELLGSLLK